MDHLFNDTNKTREELENTINKNNNDMNRGIEEDPADKPGKEKDYKTGNEPTNAETNVAKLEVKLTGTLSEVYTKALQDVLNKQNGLNEYQIENDKVLKEKTKNIVKKGNIGKESQQQSEGILASQYLTNNPAYYNSLDDESIDPDYYYGYIGKNTDINNSEDVINTINRIINGYNKKYKNNNTVVLENNGIINKHIITLETMLVGFDINLNIVDSNKILPLLLNTINK